METAFRFVSTPSPCGYLPEQHWRLEYEIVSGLTPAEYLQRLQHGWRHFGFSLFRPRCAACAACRSIRVLVDRFRPDRSMRRLRRVNADAVRFEIGTPSVTHAKLALYDRYHAFQADFKSWPEHDKQDAAGYAHSFVDNPFPIQEWRYWCDDRLVGVGYVDDLPGALSAIYFYYDPDYRHMSLGTWNVLCLLEYAAQRKVPHLYLGYFVDGCRSMTYKARFVPNQLFGQDGRWHDFQT